MASVKELCSIREWAPLSDLIELIPARLNLTCVDAVAEYIAIGSDAGVVFWYNRHTGIMQKLKAEVSSRITCVKIVNSVEYMVAAGSAGGQVSVFQIQKELPPDLELVAPCTRNKPIERYTIRDLHRCVVSCCEWSKNGMKLYTGDRQGIVVLTEFDYQQHLSKSMEILSEAYEIVQLSVQQSYLLIATLYRCIVCRQDPRSAQWLIIQVGKKDRKQLLDCGGVFLKQTNLADSMPQLICGRPGLRFWLADATGNVSKTILFKDAVLRSPTWEIPILNPKQRIPLADTSSSSRESFVAINNFRELYLYDGQDSLVVTHNDAMLYLLNIERLRLEAVARGFRKILDFCVCGKEIFVLEGERSLLRLAPLPEKPNKTAKVIFNPLLPPPVPILGASHYGGCESPLEPTDNSAEECFELPPIEELDLNVPIELAVESPLAEQNRRLEIFQRIGQRDFEQSILHTSGAVAHKKSRKTSHKHVGGIVEIGQETHEHVPTFMEASYCKMENNGLITTVDCTQHLPLNLGPTTLQNIIAIKAETLAVQHDLQELELSPPGAVTPKSSDTLTNCYPTNLEEASVQTTPHKQSYCLEQMQDLDSCADYGAGQPVDGLCAATSMTAVATLSKPLKFVYTQPQTTQASTKEYNSFLPDFRCAGDPLCKDATPPSSHSNTSSEWEFLDN